MCGSWRQIGDAIVATTLPISLLLFALCAFVVWFAGARLAYLGDALADKYHLAKSLVGLLSLTLVITTIGATIAVWNIGLGTSFIGVTLLAAATSLPELTTSTTAARMGPYTMAISNIFGSNLIMLVLVFPADILFRTVPILQGTSQTVTLVLSVGITVTALYLIGLIVRRKPKVGPLGLNSVLVLIIFIASPGAYYIAR